MTNTFTYYVRTEPKRSRKYAAAWGPAPSEPATGVVWSPGPLPGSLWVLPRSGAPSSEAVIVKYDADEDRWFRAGFDLEKFVIDRHGSWLKPDNSAWPGYEQMARHALRNAPELPSKLWRKALAGGETNG
jgi:hypothetical protein